MGEFGAGKSNTGYRSQSLIDLDSAEAKSSCLNTVRNSATGRS